MKNTLEDLNNHLFAQLERLSDEDISGEELEMEIRRGKAISGVAVQIVNNGKLALEAQRAFGSGEIPATPKFLEARK
ncbi:phage-like protein [Xenorhabdus mauleonii]|uniref:Phage-like protein n=1 Tax=Xenorhabdus mauleonii TaxID=351675 RepID=A0A1I3U8X7_9GAMM|nr:hypothetical protein [Xenorhabdus mauleonii]PHM45915.1 phage-like protein [Xenorhabdus mauleonii]SFJ78306.1 hypothetical protein SAMN05421680_11621 [Xenorhabdus mauleonii]